MIHLMASFRSRASAVALVCGISGSPVGAQPKAQTASAWREDLSYLVATMKAVHPAPFHRVSEGQIDRDAAALTAEMPQLTDQQIVLRLSALVALLHDGHSRLMPAPPYFKRDRSFPVRIERFADGIFVVAADDQAKELVGGRVVSIGSHSAQAAWDSLTSIAVGDNAFSRMSDIPLFLTMPEVLSTLGLAGPDSLVLTVARLDGRTLRSAVAAVAAPFSAQFLSSGWRGPAGATVTALPAGTPGLVERHRRAPYWFAEEGRMLYAQINQVVNSRDTVPLGTERAAITLDEFAQQIVLRGNTGQFDRFVLDLRFNGGGNNALAKTFVQRISASSAVNQKGTLFVITGRETYSAAMNFASLLEERTAAIFVGEPPGGSPSHYGDAVPFTLPQSKLQFRISTLHWDLGVSPSDVREVMEPDLPAPPTFADFRVALDAPLSAVARYKDGDRLADRLLARYQAAGIDSALAMYGADVAKRTSDPWRSDVQQLLKFANAVIARARERTDVFRAFAFATERYPNAPEAWTELARVHAFVSNWPEARKAWERARALRPQSDFIRRGYEAARRR